ncbi:helix-turn-helix domain-containing protein [Pseudarthrobacter sp. 1G09]|uniref:helix-turn-helix domain-containing protein n=1 Tax=Pseudarthrobacter sp. 1G09 TaxID=3416178 RepID=UPI003CFBAACA
MKTTQHMETVARLGSAVREARKELKLTQEQLALQAHVSRAFVGELEKGHSRAELGKVLDVLGVLGISTRAITSLVQEKTKKARSIRSAKTARISRQRAYPAAEVLSSQGRSGLLFADAALALAGHEITDPALRGVVDGAARYQLTTDEALAAIRLHVQG